MHSSRSTEAGRPGIFVECRLDRLPARAGGGDTEERHGERGVGRLKKSEALKYSGRRNGTRYGGVVLSLVGWLGEVGGPGLSQLLDAPAKKDAMV